jgi:hypothetical protein
MTMYLRFWPAICLILFLLDGCATNTNRPAIQQKTEAEPIKTENSQCTAMTSFPPVATGNKIDREHHIGDELLVYAKHFEELSADNQKKEYMQATQDLSRNRKDPLIRLKTALIYALPASKQRDNARAIALLSELQREKLPEEDIAGLVTILKEYVEDRQRNDDNAAKLAQKIKDEQRRADDLQTKLDALKNIDKTMIERGQGSSK